MDPVALDTSALQMVDQVLDLAAQENGEIEAFVEPATPGSSRQAITFRHWKERADGLAAVLRSRGVKRHDVVSLIMGPSIDYAVAYQAVMRCGAVTSGINPRLSSAEQQSILDRMMPVVTIVEDGLSDSLPSSVGMIMTRSEVVAVPPASFAPDPERTADDLVAVVWTSGTTGLPKGALFDHRALAAVAAGTDLLSHVGDRKLSPLPFAHVGYMTRPWDEIANGITTIITPSPWSATSALATILNERVTLAQGVPTQWALILELPPVTQEDVASLRLVSTGAARMAPSQVAALRERFFAPVVVRYTSTETSLGCGTRLDDEDDAIATTVGRPVTGVEMVLVDLDGQHVAQGEVGRVRLRSGAVMRGYVAPRLSGQALCVDEELTKSVRSSDGWITTGDFGVVNEDGNLSLVGRDNEMYQRGGYNVYPAEVEQALDGAPGVASVAIVAGADEILGEVGVAFVVVTPGSEAPTRDSLKAFLRERVADYKLPDIVVAKEALPVTAMGKVDKKALKDEAMHVAAHRSAAVAKERKERREQS